MSSYYEKMLATGEVKCIDEEVPFEIPQGWEWERIGNLFETTSGSTPLSRNPDYYQNGSINWVRTTDLNNGVLCKTEIQITEKSLFRLQPYHSPTKLGMYCDVWRCRNDWKT